MDFKVFMTGLIPKYEGELIVDDTPGGVGFDPAKLAWQGFPAKMVQCTLEDGDIRCKEVGVPTSTSGELQVGGNKFFVVGEESINNFRAIRVGDLNGAIFYQVFF